MIDFRIISSQQNLFIFKFVGLRGQKKKIENQLTCQKIVQKYILNRDLQGREVESRYFPRFVFKFKTFNLKDLK